MSYSLISTNYIEAEYGVKLVQGIKNGRTPRGAIRGGNGSFIVKNNDPMPAQFYLYFEDENGNKKCFEAYSTIKSNMTKEKLTGKRRARISEKVAEMAAESDTYEPKKWVIKAVKDLKI